MKNSFNLFKILPGLFLLAFLSCQYGKDLVEDNGCIRIKIVATICSEVVYQVQDEKYYDLGENGWGDGKTKIDHVFFSYLNCTDLDYLGKLAVATLIGKELDVRLVTENAADFNCASCKATLGNRPSKKHKVEITLDGCN